MKKGISFYFGYANNINERIRLIKEFGFDSIITSADKKFKLQNGSIKKQCKLFKKYNISLSSLHFRYEDKNLHYFWEKGKIGEKLKKNLIKDIKIAKKFGFKCVVVHVKGEYSEIGEKRLLKVLEYCEKLNLPIAIENIDCQKLFLNIFDKINHKMLKFCYDSGHNNVFDKNFDYLKKFKDKLIAVHLHDNDGNSDQHTLNKYGTIDWDNIAKKLIGFENISLDYEVILKSEKVENISDCLHEIKKQEKILKYNKKYEKM